MRLHHRVRVASWLAPPPLNRLRLWTWHCPACHWVGRTQLTRLAATHDARHHAIECEHLRALNRQTAYWCRNCTGTGSTGLSDCPACLGRGWEC